MPQFSRQDQLLQRLQNCVGRIDMPSKKYNDSFQPARKNYRQTNQSYSTHQNFHSETRNPINRNLSKIQDKQNCQYEKYQRNRGAASVKKQIPLYNNTSKNQYRNSYSQVETFKNRQERIPLGQNYTQQNKYIPKYSSAYRESNDQQQVSTKYNNKVQSNQNQYDRSNYNSLKNPSKSVSYSAYKNTKNHIQLQHIIGADDRGHKKFSPINVGNYDISTKVVGKTNNYTSKVTNNVAFEYQRERQEQIKKIQMKNHQQKTQNLLKQYDRSAGKTRNQRQRQFSRNINDFQCERLSYEPGNVNTRQTRKYQSGNVTPNISINTNKYRQQTDRYNNIQQNNIRRASLTPNIAPYQDRRMSLNLDAEAVPRKSIGIGSIASTSAAKMYRQSSSIKNETSQHSQNKYTFNNSSKYLMKQEQPQYSTKGKERQYIQEHQQQFRKKIEQLGSDDTIQKLHKINDLNEKINQRIKNIISNFETK